MVVLGCRNNTRQVWSSGPTADTAPKVPDELGARARGFGAVRPDEVSFRAERPSLAFGLSSEAAQFVLGEQFPVRRFGRCPLARNGDRSISASRFRIKPISVHGVDVLATERDWRSRLSQDRAGKAGQRGHRDSLVIHITSFGEGLTVGAPNT